MTGRLSDCYGILGSPQSPAFCDVVASLYFSSFRLPLQAVHGPTSGHSCVPALEAFFVAVLKLELGPIEVSSLSITHHLSPLLPHFFPAPSQSSCDSSWPTPERKEVSLSSDMSSFLQASTSILDYQQRRWLPNNREHRLMIPE